VLKGNYTSDQYGEKVVFDGGYVFLQNASSGQQESIRTFQDIFINLLYGDPIFRVIEEPESHLFASGQKHLIESLAILLNKNIHNQIVIPTHSPYILRVIDNLIKANELKNQNIISANEWLNFDNISAYNLVGGEISDATNTEFRGIDAMLFDEVSNQINNEFDELLNIQYP
jgi:predicted ATPase